MSSAPRGLLLLCLVQFVLCNDSHNAVTDIAKQKSDSYDVAFEKERISAEEKAKFEKTSAESRGQSQDSGSFDEQEAKKSGHEAGRVTASEARAYDDGKNAYEKNSSGNAKKGYHRSGFVNNYHKDESGNNSSFYEDSEDENARREHDSRDEYRENKLEDVYRNDQRDGAHAAYKNANRGEFDEGRRYDSQRGYVDQYNAKNYDDERRNYLRDGSDKYFDENGNRVFYRQPNYYYPYRNGIGSYPEDYYPDYPQNHHYTYSPRHVPSHPRPFTGNSYKGELYHPGNEGYYGNSYNDYYNDKYSRDYHLPSNTYEEYVRVY